jgi:hypothetical protein
MRDAAAMCLSQRRTFSQISARVAFVIVDSGDRCQALGMPRSGMRRQLAHKPAIEVCIER